MNIAQANTEIDWQAYNRWNRRDGVMSALWTKGLADKLIEFESIESLTLLDYGCGYFDLGRQIQKKCKRIDGYDLSEDSIQIARTISGNQSVLTHNSNELPTDNYDLIVLNSVVQYLRTTEGFATFLNDSKKLLKSTGTRLIVLSDVIPEDYSPYLDALGCLWYAGKHGLLIPMIKHLFRASTLVKEGALLQMAPNTLKSIAARQGFEVEFLKQNLTPSTRRYSCILKLKSISK